MYNYLSKIKIALIVLGIIGFAAVFIALVLNSSGSNKTEVATYKKEDQKKPIFTVSSTKIDWGEINVKDTKSAEVEVKNSGASPLVITKMTTSCGCTSVKINYKSNETKEYNMHDPLNENISIEPGDTAKLTVIYRPFIMPVAGNVTRQIFIETNDPKTPSLEIQASAVVKS